MTKKLNKDLFTNKQLEKEKSFKNHCSKEVLDLIENGNKLSLKDLPEGMNSFEQNLLMPLWDDDLLIEKSIKYISEAGLEFCETDIYTLDITYNEVLKHKIIHMLLDKLKNSNEALKEIKKILLKMKKELN
jgi:hypothetical protein